MSDIKTKRASLESFLREQIIGPGVGRNRIISTKSDDYLFLTKGYSENNYEVLSKAPGNYYSSGILFPEIPKINHDDLLLKSNENGFITNTINNIEFEKEEEEDDDNNSLQERIINEEFGIQVNQMYPNKMGLTFCVKEENLIRYGFKLIISARHYKKIENHIKNDYGIRIEMHVEEFKDLLKITLNENEILGNYFCIEEVDSYFFVKQYKNIPTGLNIILNASMILGKTYFLENNSFIGNDFNVNIGITIDRLINYISKLLLKKCTDLELRSKLYQFSQILEKAQNFLSHLANAIEIYSGSYGIWESNNYHKIINIKNLSIGNTVKKIFKKDNLPPGSFTDEIGNELNTFNNIISIDIGTKQTAALSINLQLSKDTRTINDLVYCKIQISNSSSEIKFQNNNYYSVASEEVNKRCFFGVECEIISDYLEAYNERLVSNSYNDKELETIKFLYRNIKNYAIGHDCSVTWGNGFVKTEYMPHCDTPEIDSTPRDTSKKPENGNSPEFLAKLKIQQIKYLSTLSNAEDDEIFKGLNEFAQAYKNWIDKKYKIVENLSCEKDTAFKELSDCENDYHRLKYNIENYLNVGSENLKKFRLMNTSMFIQMWHGKHSVDKNIIKLMEENGFDGFNSNFYKNKCQDDIFQPDVSASWRSFQLAFIILNIDGIFNDNPTNEIRNNQVDLIWFPTGGGKTEAYLGLISLTILHRRMKYGEKGGGTAAVMRYTLRLLTLQQFQRASKLIIALEIMRRGEKSFGQNLGIEPIRIGLYVGNNQIPNKTKELLSEFKSLSEGKPSKIPFDKCIVCGSKIKGYQEILSGNKKNEYYHDIGRLECTNHLCAMRIPKGNQVELRPDMECFPILLSDESIYQHPPALIFGTVDKFAQLAHKVDDSKTGRVNDSRRIFGRGNWEDYKLKDGYLPPDLIIQDELHLLLGPLGSAVALFESAFDQLCTRIDGTKPKIISSTATTRNTGLQIEALFNRKLSIFPKSGIDCDDNFFGMYKRVYLEDSSESFKYLSKRRYIGFLPTGRTHLWMQMRIDALCLVHRALFELDHQTGKTIEPNFNDDLIKAQNYFYSIISYFNSLKDVGLTQAQIQTYILKETRKILNRCIRSQKLLKPLYAMKDKLIEAELTGRLTGEEVKETLAKVEKNWSPQRFPIKIINEKNEIQIKQQFNIIPEFIVATNMISVGLDVSRFNTIIMNSMPRNTAEYIQASSRVAREDLGLVLTIHHPFKTRDLSHYEKFIEFHQKMYSYVEPISITPFTKNAVDKYMPLYIVTILRHFNSKFANRTSANFISNSDLNFLENQLKSYFNSRFERLNKHSNKNVKSLLCKKDLDYIYIWIDEALQNWIKGKNEVNQKNQTLVYSYGNINRSEANLFSEINNLSIEDYQKNWKVPMSLRNIEPSALIHVNHY
jgi:hypothetical protein